MCPVVTYLPRVSGSEPAGVSGSTAVGTPVLERMNNIAWPGAVELRPAVRMWSCMK